jgi:hypothetical protein
MRAPVFPGLDAGDDEKKGTGEKKGSVGGK